MLIIHNGYKKIRQQIILQNINIAINQKQIVGLAGPSGSGKSTLLRCIQKLDKLDQGTIKHQGISGFMFQDFQLFPHMNVLTNLVYGPNILSKNSKDKKINEERALNLLDKLGLFDKSKHYPAQLSGGQKQRVALARSLMMKPDLMLFDEPTSGLDVATIDDVVLLLNSIRDLGVTMVIASHDLDFLTKIAERIIVLKEGKIVADINTEDSNNIIDYLKSFY